MIKSIEEAREFFKDDIFALETTGIEILAASKGRATCAFCTDKKHMNADGIVMGGALYTLADFTASVAANFENAHTVSLQSNINYLAAARADKIVAEAVCIKDGRTVGIYEVSVGDGEGKLFCTATFTCFKKQG